MIEGEPLMRIGDVRSRPIRPQIHARRHVIPPEAHWIAKKTYTYSSVLQIGSAGQSERACPYDDDVEVHKREIIMALSRLAAPIAKPTKYSIKRLPGSEWWQIGISPSPFCIAPTNKWRL